MAEVIVRSATEQDIPELGRLHVQTWRFAYADVLPASVLDALDAAEVAGNLSTALGKATFLVGAEGDNLVGYCIAGQAPREEGAGAEGELPDDVDALAQIATLLVAPRWARRGHGGRLLASAAEQLNAAGAGRGIAWIPEADVASLNFYERAGWNADGLVRTLDAAGTPVREIRMTGTLSLRLV